MLLLVNFWRMKGCVINWWNSTISRAFVFNNQTCSDIILTNQLGRCFLTMISTKPYTIHNLEILFFLFNFFSMHGCKLSENIKYFSGTPLKVSKWSLSETTTGNRKIQSQKYCKIKLYVNYFVWLKGWGSSVRGCYKFPQCWLSPRWPQPSTVDVETKIMCETQFLFPSIALNEVNLF